MRPSEFKKIMEQYKSPMYLFDIDILLKRVEYLKKQMPKNIDLCFAMKANPFIIKELEPVIDKYEVCSFGEYQICKTLNINSEKLVISGVYKNKEETSNIMKEEGHVYTVESLEQFKLFTHFKKEIKLLLRLTSKNQFGMSEEDIEYILKERNQYSHIHILGLEYFSGTQKTLKKIMKEIDYLDEYLIKLASNYDFIPEELEYGGGFPVYYYENDTWNENEFLHEFKTKIEQMHYQGKIILELGRSISASCGFYITQIVDMKKNQNGNFAIANGGMHQMVYYGSMLSMNKPKIMIYPNRKENIQVYNVCGSLCTINDFLVKHLEADLKIGDYLIFLNTGAYAMTEGISLFLSRDLPAIIMKKGEEMIKIRESMDTFIFNIPNIERRK